MGIIQEDEITWFCLAIRPEIRLVTFHVVPVGVLMAGGVSIRLGR